MVACLDTLAELVLTSTLASQGLDSIPLQNKNYARDEDCG
jgi:hypothetical protein